LDSLGFTTDELDTLFLKSSEDADIGLNENIEEDLDLTQETLSDVKMIQLFFNAENENKFREAVNKISKENNIDNISDAVLKAVLDEANKT
jgi:phosphosulfolactate synthase (CoM biosynthesis protein A)